MRIRVWLRRTGTHEVLHTAVHEDDGRRAIYLSGVEGWPFYLETQVLPEPTAEGIGLVTGVPHVDQET